MNRADFQKLTKLRLKEAKLLLDNKYYEGAFYLAGYAVECALKACVAKKTKRYEFPPKTADRLCTHDLAALVALTGLKPDLAAEMDRATEIRQTWAIDRRWKELS